MNRLRELRKDQGFSLRKLGEEVNMNASVLGNYERGDRQPKTEVWQTLADYFKVSVPYIMGLSDKRKEIDHNHLKNLILKANSENPNENKLEIINKFNFEVISCVYETLGGTRNLIAYPIIELQDKEKHYYSILQINLQIDDIRIDASKKPVLLSMPSYLNIRDKQESINLIESWYETESFLTDELLSSIIKNIDSEIIHLYFLVKSMNNELNKLSEFLCEEQYNFLNKYFSELFNDNFSYIFKLNYYNTFVSEVKVLFR